MIAPTTQHSADQLNTRSEDESLDGMQKPTAIQKVA